MKFYFALFQIYMMCLTLVVALHVLRDHRNPPFWEAIAEAAGSVLLIIIFQGLKEIFQEIRRRL